MRIDLSAIDREQFTLKEGVFCGIPAILVTPAIQGTKWTQANKHLRSSIWDLNGNLLSAGMPKFTNAGENPEHFPMPVSLTGARCVEKLDGSLAIFDYVNGQFSCRTRGTFSYKTLENAADFDYCIAKYPLIKEWCQRDESYSVWCEITTPNQRIVIDYGPEPELTLIGACYKPGYALFCQGTVDDFAEQMGLKRPCFFTFSSVESCLAEVAQWNGLEGCVIYSGEDQHVLHKVKSDSYIRAHRFKERVTLPNLLDLFFGYGRPDILGFRARIESDFDYECQEMSKSLAEQICAAYDHVVSRYNIMKVVVSPLRALSRRDAALAIQANYIDVWRGAAFHLLDNRPLDDKTVRKLMEDHLDNEVKPATLPS